RRDPGVDLPHARGQGRPLPRLRDCSEATALHHSVLGVKVATRYEDCQALLRDNRLGRGDNQFDPALFGLTQEEFDARFPSQGTLTNSMLGLDPPDHTRLRALVAKVFTPKTV